jgi:hypothetical protein
MRLRLILSFALIVFISVASVVIAARQSAEQEVRAFMGQGGTYVNYRSSLEDYYRYGRELEVGVTSDLSGHGRGWAFWLRGMMGGGW